MEVGDEVISLGDHWMRPDVQGTILNIKSSGSVLVRWHTGQAGALLPRSLYHSQRDIALNSDWQTNPNIVFRRRKLK